VLEILIKLTRLFGKGLLLCVQGPDVLIDLLKFDEKGYLFFQSRSPGFSFILVEAFGNKKCTDVGALFVLVLFRVLMPILRVFDGS
jgi:hypothetical protein